jgi:Animal haem peroxidase
MPRLPHGMDITPDTVQNARNSMAARAADIPLGFAVAQPLDTRSFDFLFPELQEDPANLLPVAGNTRDDLVELGKAMSTVFGGDANIPAAYTYFGQFVDHDITLETSSAPGSQLVAPDLSPLPLARIRQETQNLRTGALDLDSVYGLPAPSRGAKMRLGRVSQSGARPPNKDDFNDLPREGRSVDVVHDRVALIGDPRNDENLILAQLHLAFLRAHNELVDQGNSFRSARRLLRQHYQYIVLHDFLKRIADPQIVDETIALNRVYDPDEDAFFMPLEFTVAAYRLGHSMVRGNYDFNLNFQPATLDQLFTFTALSGQLGDFDTLPELWIIEWENFVDAGQPFNKARRIDTKLVEPLEHLRILTGDEEAGLARRLAVRNLLRGYLLRMPTGQAVARALKQKLQGVRDIPVLGPNRIREGAASDEQVQVLEEAGFLERTPLWYYILAEAAELGGGQRLGPVGSTIIAEVLVGLVRRSANSILRQQNWQPILPSAQPGTFTLKDLLSFAGILA